MHLVEDSKARLWLTPSWPPSPSEQMIHLGSDPAGASAEGVVVRLLDVTYLDVVKEYPEVTKAECLRLRMEDVQEALEYDPEAKKIIDLH